MNEIIEEGGDTCHRLLNTKRDTQWNIRNEDKQRLAVGR